MSRKLNYFLFSQVDRNRRQCEQELADTNETLGDQTCTNQAITGAKQKCENEINVLSVSNFLLIDNSF